MERRARARYPELERLPEIAWTTEIAGTVTGRAAEQTGLAFGTPVIVGTIDAAAEAISASGTDDLMEELGAGSETEMSSAG
jgi:sugar (pentulose or hexulose) kinase